MLEQELLTLVISAHHNEVVVHVVKKEHVLVTQILVYCDVRLSIFITEIKLVNQVLCQHDCLSAIQRESDFNRLPKVLIFVDSVNRHFKEDGLCDFIFEKITLCVPQLFFAFHFLESCVKALTDIV